MFSRLRKFSVGTFKTFGFFTWGLSCAWLFQEYVYDWAVRPPSNPALSQTQTTEPPPSFPILDILTPAEQAHTVLLRPLHVPHPRHLH